MTYQRPKFYDTADRIKGVRVGDTILIKLKVRKVDVDSDIPLCVGNKDDPDKWMWLNLAELEDFEIVIVKPEEFTIKVVLPDGEERDVITEQIDYLGPKFMGLPVGTKLYYEGELMATVIE